MYPKPLAIITIIILHCIAALPSPTARSKHTCAKTFSKETHRSDDSEFESFMEYLKREEQKDRQIREICQISQIRRDDHYTGFFAPRHIIEAYLRTLDQGESPDTSTTPEPKD
jgi:hypothetical protein